MTTDNLKANLLEENERLKRELAEHEKREAHYWWKLGMANARRSMKANKATSNQSLMMNLFGSGFGTARRRCVDIGLDPDGNKTSLSDMHPFDAETPQQTSGSDGDE